MVYIYVICVIILLLLFTYLYRYQEGFQTDLLNGKDGDTGDVHQVYTIPDDFLGSLCMFKERSTERSTHIYAYNKRDETIYRTKETTPVTFRKNRNGWEKVVEIPSLNDYDLLGNKMILATNDGVRVYDVSAKSGEFMDIYTDIIDTTFIENTSVSYIRTDGVAGIDDVLTCRDLSKKVNEKNEKQGTTDVNNPVEYIGLNAEECQKYASDIANLPYKYEPRSERTKGCIEAKLDRGTEIHYNDPDVNPLTSSVDRNYYRKYYTEICKQIKVTDKLSENIQATTTPKVFKLMDFSPTTCAVEGVGEIRHLLLCDRNRRTIVPLNVSSTGTGMSIRYNGDKITTDENVFVFTKAGTPEYKACVLEDKINHLYEFDFTDSKSHIRILDYAYWNLVKIPQSYGMTRDVLDDAIIYGVWMNNDILIIYGVFRGLFQSENERILMLKLRFNADSVQLEDFIRLPASVSGSDLRNIYERMGSSNLYYKKKEDFVLATNKTKSELSFYGKTGTFEGTITTEAKKTPNQPSNSNAINKVEDYNLSNPASQGINDYLMYPDNTTGSKDVKEGDHIYFVLRSPILLKGIAIKTLNSVYVKAFKVQIPNGDTNISGMGGILMDKTTYDDMPGTDFGIKDDRKNKVNDIDMYHLETDIYVSMIRITILKLVDANNPLAMGNLVSKFQGVLYGLRTQTDEAMQRQYDAQNAKCEEDYQKALELNALNKEEEDAMKSKMNEIKKLLKESSDGKSLETKCSDYFKQALSYFNNPNSTREEKLEALKLYRQSISACSEVITNKYTKAQRSFNADAEKQNKQEMEILRKLRRLENTIEKIKSYDGGNTYLDGYNQGYNMFNDYIEKRSEKFKEKHIGSSNKDGNRKKLETDINGLKSSVDDLETKIEEHNTCPKQKGTINKIKNYLKYTLMYTMLNKFLGNNLKSNN